MTLASLATHTSGLPRLAADSGALAATWRLWREGTNPYGASLDDLLQRTRETRVGRPRPAYSNLGFMLLGHAVAAAAYLTYAELFAQRLAKPSCHRMRSWGPTVEAVPWRPGPASASGLRVGFG